MCKEQCLQLYNVVWSNTFAKLPKSLNSKNTILFNFNTNWSRFGVFSGSIYNFLFDITICRLFFGYFLWNILNTINYKQATFQAKQLNVFLVLLNFKPFICLFTMVKVALKFFYFLKISRHFKL